MTIAGLALSAGSTAANAAAQAQAARARTRALADERTRQNGFDQEAEALAMQSQDRYSTTQTQVADKGQQLGDYFEAQTTPAPSAAEALPSAGTSNITVQEENKQRAKAATETDATGRALGNLRSFGDVLGGLGRDQARDAGQIAQIDSFKGGSSNVLPYELDAANQKGAGLKLLGDILGGAGGVVTTAGLTGTPLLGGAKAASLGGKAAMAARRGAGSVLRLPNLYQPGTL